MTPQEPHRPLPSAAEIESRLQALSQLRWQMLELHARLEYLRLMLQLGRPGRL